MIRPGRADEWALLHILDKLGKLKLRSRARLVAATVLLQAIVIGVGWFGGSRLATEKVTARAHEQLIAENERVAESLSAALTRALHGAPADDGDGWMRFQHVVETFPVPPGATVFVLDHMGRVRCHPLLRIEPGLARIDFSDLVLSLDDHNPGVPLNSLFPNTTASAKAQTLAGPAWLSMTYNRALRARVVIYQHAAGLRSNQEAMIGSLRLWSGLAGVVVLAVTVAGSWLMVRRYDTVLMRVNTLLEREVDRRIRQGLVIRNALIFGLAKLADFRDSDTGGHLDRICDYVEVLARTLQPTREEITEAWIERLKLAASMHDIGKVGIPDAVLLKPGAFTPEERAIMERHTRIGHETLVAIRHRVGEDELLNMGAEVALLHHERWDGRGYPHGLAGEAIPLAARIVALADVYDALRSKRTYKDSMSHAQACEIIRKGSGTHFDPAVAAAFELTQQKFDEISRQEPASGMRLAEAENVGAARAAA